MTNQSATLLEERTSVIGDRYVLEQLIGSGGTSEVWRGVDTRLLRPVAVKVLYPQFASTTVRERVQLEARAAAQLDHPAVVRIFDCGETERGLPVIVMELLRGRGLRELLEGRTRLSAVDAVRLLLPISDALALAHSQGIVHRDVKPENVHLKRVGRATVQPTLLDFGVAHVAVQQSQRLTMAGALLGTPSYMSPEQVSGAAVVDDRTDTWSLCVTLYELVSGNTPFEGDNLGRLFAAIRSAPLPYPRHLPEFDGELFSLLAAGTRKDASERPATGELTLWLAHFLEARGVSSDLAGRHLSSYRSAPEFPPSSASPRQAPEREAVR